ncbi:MAG: hypothetical protein FWF59_03600 [Turicibacter sp.]|nr:hypothetical protein [Turicibacter sp.]
MPGRNGEKTEARWTMRMSAEEKKNLYSHVTSLGLSANKYVLGLILADLEKSARINKKNHYKN